jgi:hypothetical protein
MAQIDYLILSDSAQAVNGKLYLLGGGWTHTLRLVPQDPALTPLPSQFAVAVGLLVGWNEGNDPLQMRVTLEDADARNTFIEVGAQLVTGRPPQATAGADLKAVMAIPITIVLPQQGQYCIRAQVTNRGETNERTAEFTVVDQPVSLPPQGG